MKAILILMVVVSLLISGCTEIKIPIDTSKNPNKINEIANYGVANEIKKNCKVLNEQCWNTIDELISGNITMQGQISNLVDGKVYVNSSSIFDMPLPNLPTVLLDVNKTSSYNALKVGQKIKFTSRIKPLTPTRDVLILAIVTYIFPQNKIIEAQKTVRALQKISKIEMLFEISDVKIEDIR